MIITEIKKILDKWLSDNKLNDINYVIDKSKNITISDFSTNIALLCSKRLNNDPMVLAEEIVKNIDKKFFSDITITKPGFINFVIGEELIAKLINEINSATDKYGRFERREGKYSVEYVSANPTGYIHIGHARNAILGNCILNLLDWYGHPIVSEYVVNDAGNQMNNLATAVFIRYMQLFGHKLELPEDSYHGDEIIEVAQSMKNKFGDKFTNLKLDNDGRIDNRDDEHTIRWFARDYLLQIIKDDLKALGVEIELYFSEFQSHQNGMNEKMIERLLALKAAYKKDGAIWLETTKYGDDKDRVLVKSDGIPTYFAPDIVYHDYKFNTNKTNFIINIWGADHYSYIKRMKIAMQCLGYNPDHLTVVCMQMVKLVKDGQPFKMSKRTGQSLTARDLVQAIGKDAARWYLVSQSANNHIIIDVSEATNKNNNNPIFYVQYAHARANQLLNKQKLAQPNNFSHLTDKIEHELINELEYFKFTIENCAKTFEPYKMTVYLLNLAKLFHSYYSNTKIFDSNNPKSSEQYYLIKAVKQVLHNGLQILGINAPDKM